MSRSRVHAGIVAGTLALAFGALGACGCARSDARVVRVNEAVLSLPPEEDRAGALAAALSQWQQTAASQAYPIGPGDVLQIQIYELEDLNKSEVLTLQVGPSGEVRLPLIGSLTALGQTTTVLREAVERKLAAEYMVDPQVSVSIKEYHGRQVAVMGAVAKPGVFTLCRNAVTLLDALAMAGGLNERSGQVIYVTRGPRARLLEGSLRAIEAAAQGAEGEEAEEDADGPVPARVAEVSPPKGTIAIDATRLLEKGDNDLNTMIVDGDVIHVPEAENFFVTGMVIKPGAFALKRPTTILEAVATAGGIKDDASPEATRVIRVRQGHREVLQVDLDRIASREEDNFLLGANDMIIVRQMPSKKFWTDIGETFRNIFGVGFSLGSL